jgi:hypothetical protein
MCEQIWYSHSALIPYTEDTLVLGGPVKFTILFFVLMSAIVSPMIAQEDAPDQSLAIRPLGLIVLPLIGNTVEISVEYQTMLDRKVALQVLPFYASTAYFSPSAGYTSITEYGFRFGFLRFADSTPLQGWYIGGFSGLLFGSGYDDFYLYSYWASIWGAAAGYQWVAPGGLMVNLGGGARYIWGYAFLPMIEFSIGYAF